MTEAKQSPRPFVILVALALIAAFVFLVPVKTKDVYGWHQSGTLTTRFASGASAERPNYETTSTRHSYTLWDCIAGND